MGGSTWTSVVRDLVLIALAAANAGAAWAAPGAAPGAGPGPEVLAAAQKGMQRFVHSLTGPAATQLGFADQAAAAAANLGRDIRGYSVEPSEIATFEASGDGRALLRPADSWSFLVTSDGAGVALLDVARGPGGYEATGVGAASMARAFDALSRRWPDAAKVHLGRFGGPWLHADFAVVATARKLRVFPLASAVRFLGFEEKLYHPTAAFLKLKPEVRRLRRQQRQQGGALSAPGRPGASRSPRPPATLRPATPCGARSGGT